MAGVAIPADFEGNLLELQGLNWHDDNHSVYKFSGVGLLTFGFVYNLQDVWVNADTCTTVTWADADPCGGA